MELLRFVTRLLILERRRRCTPAGSRALTCREQAVMVLRRFRDRTGERLHMTGIVDGADTVQDAREAEHGRMRSITYALHDHLLIAGGQLAEPAAEGARPRMRPAEFSSRCLMVPVTALSTTAFLTAPTNSSGVIHQ